MRNIIILLFISIPTFLFSQGWEYRKLGNSFDGFAKTAAVLIDLENEQNAMLAVLNESDEISLTWGINEQNGINKLSIRILIPSDVNPQKVLMAFDEERTNYLVNFSYSEDKIFIKNAVTHDFKSFFSLLDIISFFKLKKTVHFRVIDDNSTYDYSFPLNGSAAAIVKTVNCPSYKRAGNWTDATFELLYFQYIFSTIDNGTKNFSSIGPACIDYLEETYGQYFFTQIKSIESENEESLPTLIFKNWQGEIIAKVKKEIYLKNYFHFSGNPKRGEDQKLQKDMESINLIYEAFQKYTDILTKDNITLEDFSNLEKKDLLPYYQSVLNNNELLDYLRLRNTSYYYYEIAEYSFEVFIEAWGE